MIKMSYLVMAVLCIAPLGVTAQLGTSMEITRCADLPSTITSDTNLHFTNSEVMVRTCSPRSACDNLHGISGVVGISVGSISPTVL